MPAEATFIGSTTCANCHAEEFAAWQGSHHHLAMQAATDDTVLGDFSGATFNYAAAETVFEQDGEHHYVRTPNAAGEMQRFRVTHTFGVEPLQQYLFDMPGGRKQALTYLWDARTEGEGGQRWYHLYPDESAGPGDVLHWTGRYFNWNQNCAECHSTDLQVNYDLASDTFDTTYSEVSVGCEACHGPGSQHVEWHENGYDGEAPEWPVDFGTPDTAAWVMNTATGIAERSEPLTGLHQAESCGRCHARRSVIAEDYEYGRPLTATHLPALLDEGLYHADGRILDEVYVYGSFLQSKMYTAGVECTDCHDPHTAKLQGGVEPNEICAGCHLPARFDSDDHYAQSGQGCVDCHMPETTYMGVDPRRDHSFRVPGAGNEPGHYGALIADGRAGDATNARLLAGVHNDDFPGIARATLLTLLQPPLDAAEREMLSDSIDDPDPLVRVAALRALRQVAPDTRLQHGSHLLRDDIRAVRLEAALTYIDLRDLLPVEDRRAFGKAADEYRAAQRVSASMPDALLALASFESQLGNESAAFRLLELAVERHPGFAPAHHEYGLALVRAGRHDDALAQLEKAATEDPDTARFRYVYGVALNSLGLRDRSLSVLRSAAESFPDNADIAWALATVLRDAGEMDEAREVAERMRDRSVPGRDFNALAESLEHAPTP